MKLIKRGVPQGSILRFLSFLVHIEDLGAHKSWQSEIIKYAFDTVMIQKLNFTSEDKKMFQHRANINRFDCNYTKAKFNAVEKI